jgi:uncharacterized protein YukE
VGTGAKPPSPLAPFARNWVGGDIHGLSAYAGTLYGYVPELTDVATALDTKVSQVVSAASWQGAAASAFARAWGRDAAGVTALGVMLSAAGDIVNTLAVNLAAVQCALEEAADQASAHGVPAGADGQPRQACCTDPAQERWRASYQAFWNQCRLAAATARTQAASALQQLATAATEGGGAGLGNGDHTALFDTLAGFFGAQTRYRAYTEGKLPGLRQRLTKASDDSLAAAREANGRFAPWSDQARQDYGDASDRLKSVRDQLAGARGAENPFSQVWGLRPGDIPAGGGEGDGTGGAGGGLPRFAADIPSADAPAGAP